MQYQLSKIDINLILSSRQGTTSIPVPNNDSHITNINYKDGNKSNNLSANHSCTKNKTKNNTNKGISSNHEATSRRLRYHHYKRQMHLQTRDQKSNWNSYKFNDTKHFYQINGTPTNSHDRQILNKSNFSLQSNLLTIDKLNNNHHNNICNNSINEQNQEQKIQQDIKNKINNCTSIININMLNPVEFIQDNQINFGFNKNKIRSKSLMQNAYAINGNMKRKSKQSEKKLAKYINPYTNKQYLHFLPKEKQKLKKHIQEIRKKQLQTNILKPCQINHIQLSVRDHNKIQLSNNPLSLTSRIRPFSTRTRILKKQSSKNFTINCQFNQQDVIIKPWDSNMWNQEDHFL